MLRFLTEPMVKVCGQEAYCPSVRLYVNESLIMEMTNELGGHNYREAMTIASEMATQEAFIFGFMEELHHYLDNGLYL